jgi:hypothetical protein
MTKKLVLLEPLNFLAQNDFKIFIYVTNTPYTLNTLNPATSSSMSNIIFFYIKVLYSNKLLPSFIDYTKFICTYSWKRLFNFWIIFNILVVEPTYSIKTLIGYARASNNDSLQAYNALSYSFQTCSYRTYTNQETKDKSLCDIFYISNDGE